MTKLECLIEIARLVERRELHKCTNIFRLCHKAELSVSDVVKAYGGHEQNALNLLHEHMHPWFSTFAGTECTITNGEVVRKATARNAPRALLYCVVDQMIEDEKYLILETRLGLRTQDA